MQPIRVLLADDHVILREGLRTLINSQPDMQVVAEAANGTEALLRAQEETPEVICLDLTMPGMGGIQVIERLRLDCPQIRVLVLTMHNDAAYLRAALAAGCRGYIVKTTPLSILLEALRQVAAGKVYIDETLREHLTGAATEVRLGVNVPEEGATSASQLSPRERAVLEGLVQGYTHQEIADKLHVSIKTVETYRSRVREKLGLRTRADFVRYALEVGLLNPPAGEGTTV